MLLLNASRYCVSAIALRSPWSYSLTLCGLFGKDPNTFKLSIVQRGRTFYSNYRSNQISRPESKPSHLAISRPRLYKELQAEKAKDNIPEGWDLIFSQGRHSMKLTVARWAFSLAAIALPVVYGIGFWQYAEEEDVLVAGMTISKTTEFTLFILLNTFLVGSLWRVVINIPKRIYFNHEKESYIAVVSRLLPWKTARIQFSAMDVRQLTSFKTPLMLKPWRDNEFHVKNRVMILPHMSFHNGHDRYWLLRFKDLPDNLRR